MNRFQPHSRLLVCFSWCLLTCCFAVAQPANAGGATAWVDIDLIDGHLLVDSEIAGIPGHALIDTGAESNAINGRFLAASDLSFPTGRKVKIVGAFGTAERNTYREIPVKIFGTEMNFADLVEVNTRPETQLIIGAGFLKLFIFQFDYPNQRMRMITRDSLDLKKLKNVESKRDSRGGSPLVKVRLNDEVNVWLVMDTGASGGILLDRSVAVRKDWLDRYPTLDGVSSGANTRARLQRFNLPGMTFGEFEIENPIISVPVEGKEIALFETTTPIGTRVPRGRKAKGLLGYDVLKHFVVTIDYKNGHVHIEPGSRLQQDD